MIITAIAAMDRTGLIGAGGKMPWHLPHDLKRFRKLTLGKPVILGRKTLESIGGPLPGRTNIVLTRNDSFEATGCRVARSIDEALRIAEESGGDEAMIIGGGVIYEETAPFWDRALLTIVCGEFRGDKYFPLDVIRGLPWVVTDQEFVAADARNPHGHWFVTAVLAGHGGSGPLGLSEWLRERADAAV